MLRQMQGKSKNNNNNNNNNKHKNHKFLHTLGLDIKTPQKKIAPILILIEQI